MTLIWCPEEAPDFICSAATTASAIRLTSLPALAPCSKAVIALYFNVTSRLSRSNSSAPAFTSDRRTPVSNYTGMTALPAISDNCVSALAASRATIVTSYFCIAADAAFSPTLNAHKY